MFPRTRASWAPRAPLDAASPHLLNTIRAGEFKAALGVSLCTEFVINKSNAFDLRTLSLVSRQMPKTWRRALRGKGNPCNTAQRRAYKK